MITMRSRLLAALLAGTFDPRLRGTVLCGARRAPPLRECQGAIERGQPASRRCHHRPDRRAARPHAALQGDRRLDPDQQRRRQAAGRDRLHRLCAPRHRGGERVPSPSCSTAARAPRPPICSSARWAHGGCRSTTSRRRRRRPSFPIRRPGSISPTSCSSIRSAPATAASSTRATRCASSSGRSTATSMCSRPSCASGSRRPDGRPRRNSSRARAMAASARRSSPPSSTSRASASAGWSWFRRCSTSAGAATGAIRRSAGSRGCLRWRRRRAKRRRRSIAKRCARSSATRRATICRI